MVDVIDKIPSKIVTDVEKWVTSTKIPWYYFRGTLGPNLIGSYPVEQDVYTIHDMPRFSHNFHPRSTTPILDKNAILPLVMWLKQNVLPKNYNASRIMGNLTTQLKDGKTWINVPHIDSENVDSITFLYYVNDSDGKTVFFKNKKIYCETSPVRGTGALFPANTVHAGQLPCIHNTRYVINMIFGKRD